MSDDTGTAAEPAGSPSTETADPPSTRQTVFDRITKRRELGVFIAFVVLFGLIAVTRPDVFFDWSAMSGIMSRLLHQVAPFFLVGIGMTYLIIGGEFDLSVGSMFAVGGLLFATIANEYAISAVVAMALVLVFNVGVGATNGLLTTKIGVPSPITTIGMLSILRGIAFFLTPGGSLNAPDSALTVVLDGTQMIAGVRVSNQVFYALVLLILFGAILQHTRFGHHVYATGDSEESARKTGINTDRVKITGFVLSAVLAALAGMMAVSQFGSMFGSAGRQHELSIIAAVIVGGTDLFGGEGTITGTFLGTFVIGIIPVLLLLNGLAIEIQELLTGAVIILTVILDLYIRR